MAEQPKESVPQTTSTPQGRSAVVNPFDMLRNQIDRVFEDFSGWPFGRSGAGARALGPALTLPAAFTGAIPAADVAESDGGYEITVELPGVAENEIELQIRDDVLSLKAEKHLERKDDKQTVHVSERQYGAIHRSFRLPQDSDPAAVKAQFRDGVLKVTVPKNPQAKQNSRRIQIERG